MPSFADLASTAAGWPRRIAALGCLALAAASALTSRPGPVAANGDPVVVAARDLPAGAHLDTGDLRVASYPAAVRPSTALPRIADAVGRRLAGPVRAGEAVTVTRLAGAQLTAGLAPGLVAAPVELAGHASTLLVQPGATVDLLVADPPSTMPDGSSPGPAHVLAQAVRVLAVGGSSDGGSTDGVAVVVAVDPAAALRIAAATGRVIVATPRPPP